MLHAREGETDRIALAEPFGFTSCYTYDPKRLDLRDTVTAFSQLAKCTKHLADQVAKLTRAVTADEENPGLPQTREGERPSGSQQQLQLFPPLWQAGSPLPQAPPNSSTFPTEVSSPACPVHHELLPSRHCASAGRRACAHSEQGAASSVGKSRRDLLERPEQHRERWAWESPSLAATRCKFPDSA